MINDLPTGRYVPISSQSVGWVNVVDEKGKVRSLRYDIFVALLFKQLPVPMMKAHAAMGINEEAGEVSTLIKREIIYNKPFDRAEFVKELGDLRFFIQAAMNMYDIPEQEILQTNANKLSERYKSLTYSDSAANARADERDQQGKEAQ